jgi:hypothetical protein
MGVDYIILIFSIIMLAGPPPLDLAARQFLYNLVFQNICLDDDFHKRHIN